MKVLGINGFCFDASVALVVDGVPVFYAEEERLNREKKTREFPRLTLGRMVDSGLLAPGEIDAVVCPWDPVKGFLNSIRISLQHFPESLALLLPFSSSECNMVYGTNILFLDGELRRDFRVRKDLRVTHVDHHLSHASLAFYTSPFDAADVLVMDGFGDDCSVSVFEGSGTRLVRTFKNRMFQSLGLLYSTGTLHLGFQPYREEGTVMGLAAHGDRGLVEAFRQVVRLKPGGRFSLDPGWVSFHKYGEIRPFTRRFLDTFGPRRAPGAPITREHMAFARALQEVTEETLLHVVRALALRSRSRALCFAGGVALNCVANGRLAQESGYDAIHVPAAPGDGGTSLGAALHVSHSLAGLGRNREPFTPYLGFEYSRREIHEALEDSGLAYAPCDDPPEAAARLLSQGKVVGWHSGRTEMGPRALGGRSILADPRSAAVKERLDSRVKRREWFRPYAPSVMESEVHRYFPGAAPSPYMSFSHPVREDRRGEVPAVVHVDGSARLQSVSPAAAPDYHALIRSFHELTGVPMVLNTSFNCRAPMVETPAQAVAAVKEMGLDALVIGDFVAGAGVPPDPHRLQPGRKL